MNWIRFNEWCASRSKNGQIRNGAGIQAAWSHTSLIINNLTALQGPLHDAGDLRSAALASLADGSSHDVPWIFGIPEPWLPLPFNEAGAIVSEAGLRYQMYMTAMECEGPLAAPLRPLPNNVEVTRIRTPAQKFDALNLNSSAYGMPVEVTHDVLAAGTYFSSEQHEFGIVVYNADGLPVSTATAIDLDDWIYIAAVATDPEHRRNGYAELAMRAALDAAPKKPTALDASRMGEPLYAQMGFQRRFQWHFWVPGE